jgi:hypothetical protein
MRHAVGISGRRKRDKVGPKSSGHVVDVGPHDSKIHTVTQRPSASEMRSSDTQDRSTSKSWLNRATRSVRSRRNEPPVIIVFRMIGRTARIEHDVLRRS